MLWRLPSPSPLHGDRSQPCAVAPVIIPRLELSQEGCSKLQLRLIKIRLRELPHPGQREKRSGSRSFSATRASSVELETRSGSSTYSS